jgi:hypothetical protein
MALRPWEKCHGPRRTGAVPGAPGESRTPNRLIRNQVVSVRLHSAMRQPHGIPPGIGVRLTRLQCAENVVSGDRVTVFAMTPTSTEKPEFVTLPEIAERLRCSPKTANRQRLLATAPGAYEVTGRKLWKNADIDA